MSAPDPFLVRGQHAFYAVPDYDGEAEAARAHLVAAGQRVLSEHVEMLDGRRMRVLKTMAPGPSAHGREPERT